MLKLSPVNRRERRVSGGWPRPDSDARGHHIGRWAVGHPTTPGLPPRVYRGRYLTWERWDPER